MIQNPELDRRDSQLKPMQAVGLLINYFVGYQWLYPQLGLFFSKQLANVEGILPPITFSIYCLTLVISILLSWKYLKYEYTVFKKNPMQSLKAIGIMGGVLLALNGLAGLIMLTFLDPAQQAYNQTAVVAGLLKFPILNIFSSIIFAPIVEELVFRGVFFQFARREGYYKASYILTGFIFGSIHALPSLAITGNALQLLYIIPYGFMGIFMAYAYEMSGSIWASIGVHFLNNLLATLVVLLPLIR